MTRYNENSFRQKLDVFFKKTTPIIMIVVTLMLSLLVVYRYGYISERLKKLNYNPFENKEFDRNLMYSDYYLNYKIYQSEHSRPLSPAEFYLTDDTVNTMLKNIDLNYYSGVLSKSIIENKFNKAFDSINDFIDGSNGNLKYYVEDLNTGYSVTNYNYLNDSVIFTENHILSDNANSNVIKDEKKKKEYDSLIKMIKENYQFYAIGDYDQNGKFKLIYVHGADFNITSANLLEVEADISLKEDNSSDDALEYFENYRVNPIKNKRYIYCIPKNITSDFYNSDDSISSIIYSKEKDVYLSVVEIADIVWIIVLMLALMTRFRYMHYNNVFYIGERFPAEILLIMLSMLYTMYFENYFPLKIIRETVNGNIVQSLIENGLGIGVSKFIANAINVAYWYILFRVTYFTVYHLKYISHMGIVEYFKKNSLIVKFLSLTLDHIKDGLKRSMRFLIDTLQIDLGKKYNRLTIVGLIFVLTWLLLIGFLGIKAPKSVPWVVFLSIVAFLTFMYICMKEMERINDDYNSLIEITTEIADGNLDKNIEIFHVGLFEDVKYKLQEIQTVYKKALEEEVKSQKLKSELISNVSHDLKTPLTSIITYADLLNSVDNMEDARFYIDTINRKSERLKILIDDLFEITKAQTGNIIMDIAPLDIVELLKMSVNEIIGRIEANDISLKTSYPEHKIIVHLDGEKTYRVFENLLVNMAKYAMKGSRAYVELLDGKDDVTIVFRNISATEIDYEASEILERFRRGDKSRSTEGSGLGVSIAKSYVELQGGSFDIQLDGDLFKVLVVFQKDVKNNR